MDARACLLSIVLALGAACAGPEAGDGDGDSREHDAVLVLEAAEPADPRLEDALLARARATDGVVDASIDRDDQGRFELALFVSDPEAVERVAAGLAHRGDFEIAIVAEPEDGVDLAEEQRRLRAWLATHPDAPLAELSEVDREEGGPDPRIRWAEQDPTEARSAELPRAELPRADRCVPLLVQADPAWRFVEGDIAIAYRTSDVQGHPAVGFELAPARKGAFGDFTEAYVDHRMAIEVGGFVRSLATINERLPGAAILQGRFSAELVDAVAAALGTGTALPSDARVVEIRR